jgi:nicotinamide riboside kinase
MAAIGGRTSDLTQHGPHMRLTVALLGAESTGKSTLAQSLADTLRGEGHRVALVSEYLREFCDAQGRTPQQHEQQAIAAEQTRRIRHASATHDIVIADTTALMIAIYSEHVFGDTSLYAPALAALSDCGVVLLTALDLPWQADGLQRDGPHVRAPVQALLRSALARSGMPYAVVSGLGEDRLHSALQAVRHALGAADAVPEEPISPRWQWLCERCSDGDCERHARLLPQS